MKRSSYRGRRVEESQTTPQTDRRIRRAAVETLEQRVFLSVTTEHFNTGKGPFNTTFEWFAPQPNENPALSPQGLSDAGETLQLTDGHNFQVVSFQAIYSGPDTSTKRMRVIGYAADNSIIYDNQFNTPVGSNQTISPNVVVHKLEFQPITVLQNNQQFVNQGVLRIKIDDFTYDEQVPANSPPQLTGMGAGFLGSFKENGQVSIFDNPGQGIHAFVQDSDNDTLTVDVLCDDPARGFLIGQDVDGDGKYFQPVNGDNTHLRLTGTPAQLTSAIREVALYFANVDDKVDTGQDYIATFTVKINDQHNPEVVSTVSAKMHGVNEAPSVTSSANVATLAHQLTFDRDTITPFQTFTIDDPDNKPIGNPDVLPDTLDVNVKFTDATGVLVGSGWSKTGVSGNIATWHFSGIYSAATNAIQAVQFNPTDTFSPGNITTTSFTISVTDQGDPTDPDPASNFRRSDTFASVVSVDAKTNTSPLLGGGPVARGAILENANSPGVLVSSLVASPNLMTDDDTDQHKAVAIVAAAGAWQYSTDGTNWTNFGAVSASSALVLSETSQVRLLGSDVNGQVSFTYKAWDRSSWLTNIGGTASSLNTPVHVDASGFSTPPQNVSPFSLASVANNQPITAVNDAPNVVNGTTVTLATVAEDAANPAGATVANLFGSHFSDADDNQTATGGTSADLFAGVAVVGNAATVTTGVWQFSSNGGTSWAGIGFIFNDANALLIDTSTLLRFIPAPNFNGAAPALTVRLIDDSSGTISTGATANTSGGGDPTPYSAATLTAGLTVTAANDAPTIVNGSTATLAATSEDAANPPGATVTTLFGSHFSDAADTVANGSSANGFAGVAITGNAATAAEGKWQYLKSGTWWDITATPSNATLVKASDSIRFLPAANFNGAVPALTVHLVDDSAGAIVSGTVGGIDLSGAGSTGGTTQYSASTVALGETVTEVNDAPTAANDTLTDSPEDVAQKSIPFSTLTANDSAGPANESGQTLIVKTVGNPVGGTVSIVGTNVIFVPTADYFGGASFTFTVQDDGTTNGVADPKTSAAAATASFTITEVNDPPIANDDTLPSVAQGTLHHSINPTDLIGNDTPGPVNESSQQLTVTDVNGAVGGTVSLAGGVISFDIDPGFTGTASFLYTVADDGTTNGSLNSRTATATASFDVLPTDVSVAVSPASVTEDGAFNLVYTFTRTGITTAGKTVNFAAAGTATFAAAGQDYVVTSGGTFTFDTTTGLGTVSFLPNENTATITVNPTSDNINESSETADITVAPGTGYNATGSAASGQITNDDSDVKIELLAASSVAEDGAGNLVYTLTRTGFVGNPLTVNLTVGGTAGLTGDYGQNFATFNSTTGAATATFAAGVGTATVTIDPTVDVDNEPDETVILTLNAAGASTGNGGYSVSAPNSATGTISNDDGPIAPTATSQSVSTAQDTAKGITLTGTDPNSPPAPLTYIVTTSPAHGTLSGTAPNLTYTPNAGYFGADSFQFKTNNGTTDSSIATASISVIGKPTANAQSVNAAQDTAKAITLTGSDPNSPPKSLTYIVTTSPAHGTLSGTAPNLIYTPTAGYFGPDSFGFKVNNGTLDSSVATLSITVVGKPTANAQSVTTPLNSAVPVTLTGSDPNTPPLALTYIVTTTPAHGTLSGTAPNLTYTPTAGYVGPDSFQFKTNNGTSDSNVATLSITVGSTVSVAVSPSSVGEESGGNLVYTFTRGGDTTASLTANFSAGGSASFANDYVPSGATTFSTASGLGTITFAAGSATADLTLTPTNDTLVEGNEDAVIFVNTGSGYGVGASPASGLIVDNDSATVSFVLDSSNAPEATATHNVDVRLVTIGNGVEGAGSLAADYEFSVLGGTGTATDGGVDYTFADQNLKFAAGDTGSTKTVSATITNDAISEFNEVFPLVLDSDTPSQLSGVSLSGTNHLVTIVDNDVDLKLTVEGPSTSAIAGDGLDKLKFTFTLRNNGLTDVTNASVNLVFTLPSGVTFESAQSISPFSGSTWSSINLGVGQQEFLVLDFTADHTTANNAIATVKGTVSGADQTLVNTTDDSDTTTGTVIRQSDLVLEKSDSPDPVGPGGELVYTITVDNHGPSDNTLANITDHFPTGFANASWTSLLDGATGPSGTGDVNAMTSIPAHGRLVITVTGTVTAAANTTLSNTASLTSSEDTNDQNNFDSEATFVGGVDLKLSKSADAASLTPGQLVKYTLTYRNGGFVTAQGVSITDTIPANTVFDLANSTAGWQDAMGNPLANGAGAGTAIQFPIGSLPVSDTGATIILAVRVNSTVAAGANTIDNTADISDNGAAGTDITPSDNEAGTITTLNAAPDLMLSKTDGGGNFPPGSVVKYTLTYANVGNQDSGEATITETVPDNTTFDAADSNALWSQTGANTYELHTTALTAGAAAQNVVFAVTVNNPLPAGVSKTTNTATISDGGVNGDDPTPLNNTAEDETIINGPPMAKDLSISTDEDTSVSDTAPATDPENDTLTYAIVSRPTHGALTSFNAATGAFTYKPNANYNGPDSFTFTAKDAFATSNEGTVSITVNPVNDAPVNTVPGTKGTGPGVPITFSTANGNAFSVIDVDAGSSVISVRLSVPAGEGLLTVLTPGAAIVTGNNSNDLTISGTIANINAALAAGVRYNPGGFAGPTTLKMVSNDNGFTGAGGAKSDTDTVTITTSGARIIPDPCEAGKTAVVAYGTSGNDTITFTKSNNKISVKINGRTFGPFSITGSILAYGFDGDDTITGPSSGTYPFFAFGGKGKDKLIGGAGFAVLVGGDDNDTLTGSSRRGILIGGNGADKITGGSSDDIVIGGTTSYDDDATALCEILDDWMRADVKYAHRVDHVLGTDTDGFNAPYFFKGPGPGQTVFDDGAADTLNGKGGSDLVFTRKSSPKKVTDDSDDKSNSETRVLI